MLLDSVVLRYLSADKPPFSLLLELRLLGIVRDVSYTDMDRDGDQWTAAVAAQLVRPAISRFEVASAQSKKLAKRQAAKELIKFFIKSKFLKLFKFTILTFLFLDFDKVDPLSSPKTSSVTPTTSLEPTLSIPSISSTSLTPQPLHPTLTTLINTNDYLQLHSMKRQFGFSGDERPMDKPKEVSNVFAIIEDEGEEPCAVILDIDIGEEVGEKHDIQDL